MGETVLNSSSFSMFLLYFNSTGSVSTIDSTRTEFPEPCDQPGVDDVDLSRKRQAKASVKKADENGCCHGINLMYILGKLL